MNWYDFLLRNRSEVFERSVEHIGLVAMSMAIALAIGLPLGIALVRRLTLQRWVLGAANVVQTIPSLALFGFLIPVPWIGGVGASTAIVALALYALLPILRNTCTGIAGVDPAVIESARGMGMTPRQVLWQVQLPLAAPVMLAGIRVATVISIGVTTIAAAIGAGGLGVFIFRGVAMVNNQVILAGAIPAALLAVLADFGLGALQRSLAKEMSGRFSCVSRGRASFRFSCSLLCLSALLIAAGCRSRDAGNDRCRLKEFHRADCACGAVRATDRGAFSLHVERRVNLGGTLLCHQALVSGQIDLYPEYTGTALTAVLNDPPQNDPSAVFHRVQEEYRARFNVEVLPPLGFNNTFAMVVRGEDAEKLHLQIFRTSGSMRRNGAPDSVTNSWSAPTDIAAWRQPMA